MQRLALALVATAVGGTTLLAQAPPVAPATAAAVTVAEPIALDGQFNVDGGKHLKGITKILVPTVVVRFSARGSLTVVNQGRFFQTDGKTAKAKGKFVVAGLDKDYVQALAKQLQDDYVARLREAGFEVLTFDDVKGHPEVVKMKRYGPDKDYGMPTGGGPPGSKNTYLMAFPTDDQAIDPPMQGYAWGFRHLIKELDATLMVPEYVIDAPLLTGSKKHGVSSRGATVSVFPEMIVTAYVPFVTAKSAWGSLRLKGPIVEVADAVGEMGEAKDDSPKFANALSAGLSQLSALGPDLQAKSGTWGMKVDRTAYSAGVLRGGVSFNIGALQAIAAERSR
jgi:hypothetical protein